MSKQMEIQVVSEGCRPADIDFDKEISGLNEQIDMLSNHAAQFDYLVAVASGLLCGMLDILWVGDFDLASGRGIAEDKIEEFVKKTAGLFGCETDDLKKCVAFLEDKFPLAADGNTPDFGGGIQHHLRDFAHHPTIVGLIFSLLTQFTKMSYGTDASGAFIVVPVPEKSRVFIGEDVPDKIFKGTVVWFFHLVSDMAGSSSTAGLGGGTGIPGPILSFAKELSTLPVFKDIQVDGESFSVFLSKVFNGTIFAKRDDNGKIIKETVIKFDFRGELGAFIELGKQAIPVIANECFVRSFYFVRRLACELREMRPRSFNDLKGIDWNRVKPYKNPTLDRMLTIATGVFTTVDITEAVITQKYWVSVSYIGVGRFTVAIGQEMAVFLKRRKAEAIRNMYEEIKRNTFAETDNRLYERIKETVDFDRFGLTVEQTEILYNLEYLKTQNDIEVTRVPIKRDKIAGLKKEWLQEWKEYMSLGFPSFAQDEAAVLHWYAYNDLIELIRNNHPEKPWFRLALLETMLFEPYYALSIEKDKEGDDIPGRKYSELQNIVNGYKKGEGDKYIESVFVSESFYQEGYVKRLRKCYDKVLMELNEVLKSVGKGLAITAGVTIVTVVTAGMFAPAIAVALVGSNFAGLGGAALTSACLAYLGGGAVAAGGLGMAGGTMAIVGGGAILGVGVGAGVGGAVGAAGVMGKKATILQSAKLMVSIREIFLNDEHDTEYSDTVYEKYVQNIADIEKGLVDLKLRESTAIKDEKKQLKLEIKNTEESVNAMKIAMKSMNKFKSSFQTGMEVS